MLSFTAAGVVSRPDVVQIRVGARGGTAPRAGAPEPHRALSDAEVRANLEHFTLARRGPRTRPCRAVVWSGVEEAQRSQLGAWTAHARSLGVSHVTLHTDRPGSDVAGVEAWSVVGIAPETLVPLLGPRPGHVAVIVELSEEGVRALSGGLDRIVAARPDRVVLTWPFPPHGDPAPVAGVRARLPEWVTALGAGGLEVAVKGLPPCLLGDVRPHHARSRNRFYVDARHQGDDALLFFPDVVRFTQVDGCRHCALSTRCDGVAEAWWEQGRLPGVNPIRGEVRT